MVMDNKQGHTDTTAMESKKDCSKATEMNTNQNAALEIKKAKVCTEKAAIENKQDCTKATEMDTNKEPTEARPETMMSETGWAWMVLLGCVVSRCLTDGLIASLGMFIIAWQDHFEGSLAELTWISSLIAGLETLLGPIGSVLLRRYSIRQVVMAGASITSAAFIAASFASTTWQLYLTSTIAGCGFGLIYLPSLVVLTYYFDKKLGLVSGMTSGGSAIGLLFLPSLFQVLISYYRWQGAILILAAMVANMCISGALFRPTSFEIKVRTSAQDLHTNGSNGTEPRTKANTFWKSIVETADLELFKNIYFIVLLIAFFLYGFAYIIFIHYLPLRAVHVEISKQNAAFLTSTIGIGSVASRFTHGIIIDRKILSASSLTSLSYIICGVANLLIPVSDQYAVLITLALFLGLSSGVYHSTFPIVAKDYVGLDHVSCGLGWLLMQFGIGTIFGSYLTGVLVDATGSYDSPFYLAGISFMVCALFTSVKSLTEYARRVKILGRQPETQESELKGMDNKAVDIEDGNIHAVSGSDCL